MAANLRPLEQVAVERLSSWLPKLSYPVRIGEHDQTAFGLGLILDYARTAQDTKLVSLIETKARQFYLADRNCPLAYEPSGEDFLSPCLAEADLMRRVLPGADFAGWLSRFLPSLAEGGPPQLLTPAVVSDRSDGQIVHLDGLNLSRAWCLWGIAVALPRDDRRRSILLAAADRHARAGLIGLGSGEYMGEHWLGTFALYMLGYAGSS
jgi:hypothetical protein